MTITTAGEKGVTVETMTEEEEDGEVPIDEVIVTMTNHEGNENTDHPPPVPLKMIPQVTSRVVEVHSLVITIVYYVMLDWGPLDESSNVNTSIRRMIDIIIGLVIVGVEVSIDPLPGIDVTTVETALANTTTAITTTLSQLKLFVMSVDITKVHSSKVTFVNALTENNPDTIKTYVPK